MILHSLTLIFINTMLPIALVAMAGFALARVFNIDARPLSQSTLYIFAPALVFTAAYQSKLDSEYIRIVFFALVITALTAIITWLINKTMHRDRLTAGAFSLGTLFVNTGNYGLPLMLFAYGQQGLAYAAIYFTITSLLLPTLAIFIAARGRSNRKDAFLRVLKMPLLYAVVAGVFCNLMSIPVPTPLMKSLEIASGAAIPVMLVILGIELSHVATDSHYLTIGMATFVRLILTPIIAFPVATLMGLTGVSRAVSVIQASMPTAVMASIIAVEFNVRPKLVTGIIFVSTLFSVITLTLLLQILK